MPSAHSTSKQRSVLETVIDCTFAKVPTWPAVGLVVVSAIGMIGGSQAYAHGKMEQIERDERVASFLTREGSLVGRRFPADRQEDQGFLDALSNLHEALDGQNFRPDLIRLPLRRAMLKEQCLDVTDALAHRPGWREKSKLTSAEADTLCATLAYLNTILKDTEFVLVYSPENGPEEILNTDKKLSVEEANKLYQMLQSAPFRSEESMKIPDTVMEAYRAKDLKPVADRYYARIDARNRNNAQSVSMIEGAD